MLIFNVFSYQVKYNSKRIARTILRLIHCNRITVKQFQKDKDTFSCTLLFNAFNLYSHVQIFRGSGLLRFLVILQCQFDVMNFLRGRGCPVPLIIQTLRLHKYFQTISFTCNLKHFWEIITNIIEKTFNKNPVISVSILINIGLEIPTL